eukprot:CAMPEP_0202485252 /NCGR_PEP_ID=MMETSP1361-20130828/4135_1 /ASSEMBLY_ACC=CAM_ASM_000849 /TAXON_ID=210615 /ORGANISM="Staurosira complex sp., Strain CCMP2646" /LENGTH=433 /DNA_ID=CAMNT_0049114105 /DNA_START=236 /DNA_END=1537 /DNA_ORIENTATION=+
MTSSATNSRRPVAVSSMSSLDSSTSFLDADFDEAFDNEQITVGDANNVVSSSTLSSIGASPNLTGISEQEAATANHINNISGPPGMLLSAPGPSESAASLPAAAQAPAAPASSQPNSNNVAEFLFQLSKMLTDDNKEIIEWSKGQIKVHDPYRLQSEVLHNYFRHSKFASFQRQLNYFGFRKLAGKGKMAPCSYVNEATTTDIRSLLLIKRKAGPAQPKEKGQKKRSHNDASMPRRSNTPTSSAQVNPVLADILHRTTGAASAQATSTRQSSRTNVSSSSSQQELARAAVGRGVRHGFLPSASAGSATEALASSSMIFPDPPQLGLPDLQDSLSELTSNYQNSLQDAGANSAEQGSDGSASQHSGIDPFFQMYNFLSRDSSLVDLAMLVPTNADEAETSASVDPTPVNEMSSSNIPFLDFPGMDQPNTTGKSN